MARKSGAKQKLFLSKPEFLAVAVILVFIALFFKPVVAGDGFGYYVLLEGVMRDGTFNLSNQFRYNGITNGTTVFFDGQTKKFVSQYAPGLPLLSAPLYALSLVLDDYSLSHLKDDFFIETRGDTLIHMASVALTSLAILAIGFFFTIKLLRKEGLTKWVPTAVLLAFFGSPLIRYASYDLSYTHAAEAGLVALLLYAFYAAKKPALIGAIGGLLFMVRFTDALFLVPIGLYYLNKRQWRSSLELAAGFIPFLLLVMGFFALEYGSPFRTGYFQGSNLSQNFDPLLLPGFFNVVFGLENGLLWWTPLVLAGLYGLLKLGDNRKWVPIGFFIALFLSTSAFFQGTTGAAFGHRYYAALFAPVALGLSSLLEKRKDLRLPLIVLGVWTAILFAMHLSGDWGNMFPSIFRVLEFWGNHLTELPGSVFDKLGIVRFVFER